MSENSGKAGTTAQLFNAIGAFAITALTPVGILYTLNGNLILTAIISFVILIGIMLLSKYLIDNKRREKSGFTNKAADRTNNKTGEYVVLSAYIILAIVIFPFMFHFIDVDFTRKKDLIYLGTEKLKSIKYLEAEYNRVVAEKANLIEEEAKGYLTSYLIGKENWSEKDKIQEVIGENKAIFDEYEANSSDEMAKETLKQRITDEISSKKEAVIEEYNLGNLTDELETYYKKTEAVFLNWKIMKVSNAYYDIDLQYNKYYAAMKTEMPEFEYTKPESKDMLLDSPMASLKNASVLIILLVLVGTVLLHILVLAEYLNTSRKDSVLIMDKKKTKGAEEGSVF